MYFSLKKNLPKVSILPQQKSNEPTSLLLDFWATAIILGTAFFQFSQIVLADPSPTIRSNSECSWKLNLDVYEM